MENTEEESVVSLLVDLTVNEKVETIATFLNVRTPPNIPSFADEIPIVSVESDDSVVFISENLESNNSEDNNTVTLDVEENPLLAIELNKVEKRAADCGAGQLSKTVQSKSIQEDEKSKCETVETIQQQQQWYYQQPFNSNNGTIPKKPVVSPLSDDKLVDYRGPQPSKDEFYDVATFIWCDSISSIFFRTSELQKKYEKMKKLIKRQYSNIEPGTAPLEFEIGFPCVVYCDADWCRAEVVDTNAYPECTVALIDKGYQRKVQAIDIYPMTPELEMFPRTVLQVSLCGVYPTQGGIWNDAVAKYIGERLLGAIGPEPIKIFSRGRATSNKSTNLLTAMVCYDYMVKETSMEIGGKTRFNLNQELIDLGYCSSRPSERVPPVPVRTVSFAWNPCELPSRNDFWGKVTSVNIEGEIFLHELSLAPKLQEFRRLLSAAYHNTQPSDADLTCKPGDLCIAKYEKDGEWYRAVVQEVGSNPGRATVIFVDYGTCHSVKLENIRLAIKFLNIPIFAIRCTLHNIRVPDSGYQPRGAKAPWPLKTLDDLRSMIVEMEVGVTIKDNGVPLQVDLRVRGQSAISDILVAKCLAEFVVKKRIRKKKKNRE